MVNKQRVKRIKNLIYAFIVVVLILPVALVVMMFYKVLSLEKALDAMGSLLAARQLASAAETAPELTPQNQSVLFAPEMITPGATEQPDVQNALTETPQEHSEDSGDTSPGSTDYPQPSEQYVAGADHIGQPDITLSDDVGEATPSVTIGNNQHPNTGK